ncbi:MAG: hypothetical protein ACR2K0_08095 [Acidimicrobiales bacterium]
MGTGASRPGMGTVLAVAGVLGVLVASFLPWARSGNASRTSYELVATAQRLDVVSGPGATLVRGWYLLPVAAAGTWLAATLGRPLLTATLSTLVGSAALGLVAALRSSGPSLAVAGGTSVALAAGATALIGAARLMWEHRRSHDGSDARPRSERPSTRER